MFIFECSNDFKNALVVTILISKPWLKAGIRGTRYSALVSKKQDQVMWCAALLIRGIFSCEGSSCKPGRYDTLLLVV